MVEHDRGLFFYLFRSAAVNALLDARGISSFGLVSLKMGQPQGHFAVSAYCI